MTRFQKKAAAVAILAFSAFGLVEEQFSYSLSPDNLLKQGVEISHLPLYQSPHGPAVNGPYYPSVYGAATYVITGAIVPVWCST